MKLWDSREEPEQCTAPSVPTISFGQAEEMFGAGSLLAINVRQIQDAEREECTGRFVRAMAHWIDGDERAAFAWLQAAILYAPRCA